MGSVAGAEQSQGAGEQAVGVLLPADTFARAERINEQVVVGVTRGDALKWATVAVKGSGIPFADGGNDMTARAVAPPHGLVVIHARVRAQLVFRAHRPHG